MSRKRDVMVPNNANSQNGSYCEIIDEEPFTLNDSVSMSIKLVLNFTKNKLYKDSSGTMA